MVQTPPAQETGARPIQEMDVTMDTDKDRTYQDQVTELDRAYGRYLTKVAQLAGIRRCPSTWADGSTRCQLVDGHDQGEDRTAHRHKPAGATHAVVQW